MTTELEPLAVNNLRIAQAGTLAWLVALVVTLVVPALHTGERGWWPWTCVAGAVIGVVGSVYIHRGRGNASAA